MIDRIVARARRRLDESEAVRASAGGHVELDGKRRTVAMVVTDRRILVVDRRGEVRRAWAFTELSRDDVVTEGVGSRVRIGRPDDGLVVEIEPAGESAAVLALARERLL